MRLYFNDSISVYRLEDGDNNTEDYSLNGTIYGSVMNIKPEDTMISEGNPSQSAVLYTYHDSDIQKGDKITHDGIDYIVKGIKNNKPVRTTLRYKKAVIENLNS